MERPFPLLAIAFLFLNTASAVADTHYSCQRGVALDVDSEIGRFGNLPDLAVVVVTPKLGENPHWGATYHGHYSPGVTLTSVGSTSGAPNEIEFSFLNANETKAQIAFTLGDSRISIGCNSLQQ
jgi:hypothetical protein